MNACTKFCVNKAIVKILNLYIILLWFYGFIDLLGPLIFTNVNLKRRPAITSSASYDMDSCPCTLSSFPLDQYYARYTGKSKIKSHMFPLSLHWYLITIQILISTIRGCSLLRINQLLTIYHIPYFKVVESLYKLLWTFLCIRS